MQSTVSVLRVTSPLSDLETPIEVFKKITLKTEGLNIKNSETTRFCIELRAMSLATIIWNSGHLSLKFQLEYLDGVTKAVI